MDYGTINSTTRRAPNIGRNKWIIVSVSCIFVSVLITAQISNSKFDSSTDLIFYEHKYTDIEPSAEDGGDWMNCMRCRKRSSECQSPDPNSKLVGGTPASTWGYTLPSKDAKTNACPPRAGMITVQVRRNGLFRTEWFDKAKLVAAGSGVAVNNITHRSPPPSDSSGVVMCVSSKPGMKHGWANDNNCQPVAEWLTTLVNDATTQQAAALAAAAAAMGDLPPPPSVSEDGDFDAEPTKKVASPIRDWFAGLVADVEKASYDAPPRPPVPDVPPAEEEAEEGLDPEDKPPPPPPEVLAEDCYGPPSLGCQVACVTSCLRAAAAPPTLAARRPARTSMLWGLSPARGGGGAGRTEVLFGPGELPAQGFTVGGEGYEEEGDGADVTTGGNRDMLGINNPFDSRS